jgi:4-amino-4-deoxy-L-arabinose transferase-like glycosyltransferase
MNNEELTIDSPPQNEPTDAIALAPPSTSAVAPRHPARYRRARQLTPTSCPSPRRVPCLAIALSLGVVLRLCQYLSCQSYWQDEASLLLNALKYSAAKLPFTQLDATINTQAGPPVFLWWIKALVQFTSGSEYMMRLIPLLQGIAALFLVALIARKVLRPPAAALAVAIVALSDHLIFESATLKPYAGDLFAAALLLWIGAIWDEAILARRFSLIGIVAAIGVWTSYPLIFIFAGISLPALPLMARAKRLPAWLLANILVLASFAIIYVLSIRAQRNPYLDRYWEDRFFNFTHPAHALFHMSELTLEIFRFILPPLGIVFFPLAIIGAISWWRQKRRTLVVILIAPIVLVAIASIVHAYPYGGTRVTLFWTANLAILSAAGVEGLADMFKHRWLRCAICAIGLVPIVAAIYIAVPQLIHPRSYGDMRAVTAYVRANSQPGDLICVVGNGMPALDWYWRDHGRNVIRGVDPKRTADAPRFWIVDSYDPRQGAKSLTQYRQRDGFDLDQSHSLRIRGGDALLFVARANDRLASRCAESSEPDADRKNNSPPDDYLNNRLRQRRAHEAVMDVCNRQQFQHDDDVGDVQRQAQAWQEKWECMQHSADSRRKPGDRAARDWGSAPRHFPIIGQRFGQTHADARADRRRESDVKSSQRFLRQPRRRENRRERRDGSIHQTQQRRLDLLKNERVSDDDFFRRFRQAKTFPDRSRNQTPASEVIRRPGRFAYDPAGSLSRAVNICTVLFSVRLLAHMRYFPSGETTGSTSAPGEKVIRVRRVPSLRIM